MQYVGTLVLQMGPCLRLFRVAMAAREAEENIDITAGYLSASQDERGIRLVFYVDFPSSYSKT